MNFDNEDKLEFQHVAGGSIVEHAPVFSEQGRFIFVRCGLKVQVFVTSTGELTRELTDATSPLISLELDVKQPELLLGCTSSGELYRWHWRTGVLQKKINLKLEKLTVLTCNLLNLYKEGDTACAFVICRRNKGERLFWFVINTSTGSKVKSKGGLKLKSHMPLVDVSKGAFKFIMIAQRTHVKFINYETWTVARFENTLKSPITCVRMSPSEEMGATGDRRGRVILWRQFADAKHESRTEYHWHHTPVTDVAFSPTGVSFYSAGHESVLVKWSLNTDQKMFVPRMSSIVRHIVVSDGNEKLLACTEDNALQFVSTDELKMTTTLQHFTYALDDRTNKSLFPIGLCLNPRTNSLVLNGRVGHLQFYSAYNKSLLYNLNVVDRNVNSQEKDRIIYNTCVTRAAFNIDWMATGEVYNDHKNFPETRLKFWQYKENIQRYALNTNIELPHEHGFQSIVFSNKFQVSNLRCATAGLDNVIKLWSVGDSDNVNNTNTWICVAQASYRKQTLGSICFSQDGSILAAGFGHTLVLYDARTLRLRQALSTPAGYDGVLAKAQLRLAQAPINGSRSELSQQRQQLWNMLQTLISSDDSKIIEQARQLMANSAMRTKGSLYPSDSVKESTFKCIMEMPELGLHQKLQLLRRFGVECKVHSSCEDRLKKYLKRCVVGPTVVKRHLKSLGARLYTLRQVPRLKSQLILNRMRRRQTNYETLVKQELLPLFSVLRIDEVTKPARLSANIKRKRWQSTNTTKIPASAAPFQTIAQYSQVQFGAGEQAHLVAVCTESRVLIWNLMTLRLQAGLKLSVRHMAFDPLTNLIAVVTQFNELHVFQPNVPLPVYQRRNMPQLYGMEWLPRRQPKQSSINIDWQSQSTLLMLTHDKEIVQLSIPGQITTDDAPAPISFAQPAEDEQLFKYATFGTYMVNKKAGINTEIAQQSGPLIVGQRTHSAVDALVNLSAHTMPSMSLICGEFIKSLLTPAESKTNGIDEDKKLTNGNSNGNGNLEDDDEQDDDSEEDHDDEEEEEDQSENLADKEIKYNKANTLEVRKELLTQNTTLNTNRKENNLATLDARLRRITKLHVKLDF